MAKTDNKVVTADKKLVTYKDIISEVSQGVFRPVYLLMGDESYYIDKVTDYIVDKALKPEETAFNLTTIYATDKTDIGEPINAARRFPMGAERQVVVVKEGQNLKKLDELQPYVEHPMPTTILVLNYKNGTVDQRKKIVSAITSHGGLVCVSNRLKDGMLPTFVQDYLKRKRFAIDNQAMMMLCENIGSDLNRLSSELDKLCITLPEGVNLITPEHIEKNIGISKNFNQFELKNAIVSHDVLKANRIINYFCDNPKLNSPIATVAILFSYFANLMQAWYSPEKTEQGLMQYLDLRNSFQLRDYKEGMRFYSAMKTMRIIAKLREADARLKGIEKGNMSDADVMKELIFFILH